MKLPRSGKLYQMSQSGLGDRDDAGAREAGERSIILLREGEKKSKPVS